MASRRWPTKLVMSWEAVGDVQLCTCKEVWNFWQAVILGMFWESFELQCVTCRQVQPLSARVASDLVRPFRSLKASTSPSPYRISLRSLRNHISVCVCNVWRDIKLLVPSVPFVYLYYTIIYSRGQRDLQMWPLPTKLHTGWSGKRTCFILYI